MRQFKAGDYIIRTGDSWLLVKHGHTYRIESIEANGLVLVSLLRGKYSSSEFKLHPANGSPLLKALE